MQSSAVQDFHICSCSITKGGNPGGCISLNNSTTYSLVSDASLGPKSQSSSLPAPGRRLVSAFLHASGLVHHSWACPHPTQWHVACSSLCWQRSLRSGSSHLGVPEGEEEGLSAQQGTFVLDRVWRVEQQFELLLKNISLESCYLLQHRRCLTNRRKYCCSHLGLP